MKKLQPVVWTKGTFLSPQYLQLQDRFLENLLQFHLESLSFRPYGFRSLQISQEELDGGALAITSASGIFPDGLLFDIPGSDRVPPLKQLAECFEPDQTTLEMYLAVPQYRERGLNVATSPRQGGARYRAEFELFRDENTGLSEKPVQIARKNLRLLAEGEALEGYSAMRVGRINREVTGAFSLDPRFVPPLLDYLTSDYLSAIARRLVEILSARSAAIASVRRQKSVTLADFTASDIADFWLLYSINTALPTFRHLFETRGGHPEILFSAMSDLAGALTTFSTTIHPRDLPPYDHDNLGVCFTDLDEKLRLLIETVVPKNFVALPLKISQPFIYATSIDNDKYLLNTKMYLAIRAETSQADIAGGVPQLVKVCSANHIDHLVKYALPGVPLTFVPQPPNAIPVRLNYQYFSLSQSGASWEAIQRARNLAAYVPAELPNPQLELIILLPQPV
ncbi:MAG TPA: type VI secretion system baseplate subunit TssK [Bryobacteraceae bacterium]|nr:type VI secretion system baseplate subunit TssK [Bryobacteraceae bacterium]